MVVEVRVAMTVAVTVAVVVSSVSFRWIQVSCRQCRDGFSVELVDGELH
jgi:hypothetical protein